MSMFISRLENGVVTKELLEKVNYNLHYDLVCVGAGSAGIYAAYAAASRKIKVLLVENSEFIGGMHIIGNVGGHYYGAPGGSFESDEKIQKDDRILYGIGKWQESVLRRLDRILESGVDLRTRHTPTGLIFDGDRVVGLTVFDGVRELFISSRITVDATSDGHLIRMCDVSKKYGDTSGMRAPFTVRTRFYRDKKCVTNNRDFGDIDQYDGRDFSRKTIMSHAECIKMSDMGELIDIPPRVGVREGLSFVGEETLLTRDVVEGKAPEHPLFYAYSDFDRHGRDKSLSDELMQNWWVISNLSTVTARIPVPIGAIAPRGVRGLVSAGRCISADVYISSSVRMNRDMMRMGECVGIAAALAISDGVDFLDVDYEKYLNAATASGAFAGNSQRCFGFDFPNPKNGAYTPVSFGAKENLHLLHTETPGVAIWSCYLEREDASLAKQLAAALAVATDPLYRYNLALALGIMGNSSALPTLREIVEKRDAFYFKDCRRTNQFRTAAAICLLSRLGEPCDIPLLSQIVFDDGEYLRDIYSSLPPDYLYCNNPNLNFLYFDFFTHALVTIVKICERYSLPTADLLAKIREFRDTGAPMHRFFRTSATSGTDISPIVHELNTLFDNLIKILGK